MTPDFLLITCRINEQAEKYGVAACAYATVLIITTYGAVLIIEYTDEVLWVNARKIKPGERVLIQGHCAKRPKDARKAPCNASRVSEDRRKCARRRKVDGETEKGVRLELYFQNIQIQR